MSLQMGLRIILTKRFNAFDGATDSIALRSGCIQGKFTKLRMLSPMNTSNYFPKGHSISIEVSGSNFPRYDRNLNTGGDNYDESTWKVAHTEIHHSQL